MVAGTTLAAYKFASSKRKENTDVEQDVTINKVTGPDPFIATNRSTLPRLPFSLQGLMEHFDGTEILPSLYGELLFQLAGPYATLP